MNIFLYFCEIQNGPMQDAIQMCGQVVQIRLDFDLVNQCVDLEIAVSEFGYFCHVCLCF